MVYRNEGCNKVYCEFQCGGVGGEEREWAYMGGLTYPLLVAIPTLDVNVEGPSKLEHLKWGTRPTPAKQRFTIS